MNYVEKSIQQRNGKETPEGLVYVTELVKCPLKAYLHRISPEEYDEETTKTKHKPLTP